MVVALVLAAAISDAAAPLGLHVHQLRSSLVGLIHGDAARQVVVVERAVHLDDGQRREGDILLDGCAVVGFDAEHILALRAQGGEGVVGVWLHVHSVDVQHAVALALFVGDAGLVGVVEFLQGHCAQVEVERLHPYEVAPVDGQALDGFCQRVDGCHRAGALAQFLQFVEVVACLLDEGLDLDS